MIKDVLRLHIILFCKRKLQIDIWKVAQINSQEN